MVMLAQKSGGPYSKDEREKRQNEVCRLHFEFGYSAVKIADLMKINRNTINADIRYLYSNIKDDLKQDSGDFILRQIGRLEAQRSRIIENITEKKIDDMRYEKMLLEIDAKINNLLLRINPGKHAMEISEETIKDNILFLIIKHSRDHCLKKENIIGEIVNMQQCTITQADEIFLQINDMGLECCKKFVDFKFVYDLLEFVFLRRYIMPNDSFVVIANSLSILHVHHQYELETLKKKFKEKYGLQEKWDDSIFEKLESEKTSLIKKQADAKSRIVAEAFQSISDVAVEKYMNYINVFFGDEKTLHQKMMEK